MSEGQVYDLIGQPTEVKIYLTGDRAPHWWLPARVYPPQFPV